MKDWISVKIGHRRYKVNVLNNNGKEQWKYCIGIKNARKIQQSAIEKGLDSIICERIDGKYRTI